MDSPAFGMLVALLSFFTVVSAAAYVLALTAELDPHDRSRPRPSARRHHPA